MESSNVESASIRLFLIATHAFAPVILAVSTTAPNPLQAITALHSRTLDFPSWVDTTRLLYTLIIHPKDSPLSDEECVSDTYYHPFYS